MLSTISNFFPTALQSPLTAIPRETHAAPNTGQYETDEDDDSKSVISESGALIGSDGKKKKSKGPHETFIVVRPPPAKNNHPLNLQVQLVPPHGTRSVSVTSATGEPGSGSSSRRVSIDSTASTSAGLSRTNSYSSTYTPSDSTASISSTSTTASNLGSRRAIVPLYNLQAHNVLTNVVADAGTDAKIAKFQKRGVEVIDLGILDCVEVWPADKDKAKEKSRKSVDMTTPKAPFRAATTTTSFEPTPPGSSAVSLSSAGHSHLSHSVMPEGPPEINITSVAEPALSPIPGTPNEQLIVPFSPTSPQSKRNIFGKLFSRKDNKPSTPTTSSFNHSTTPFPVHATTGHSSDSSLRSSSPSRQDLKDETGSRWRRHSKNLSFGLSASSPRRSTHSRPASFIEGGADELGVALRGGGAASLEQRSVSPHPSLRSSTDVSKQHPYPLSSIPPTATTVSATTPAPLEVLRPPVLGLQPSSVGVVSAGARAQLYVWTMRKWIKGSDTSLIGSLLSGMGSGFKEGGSNISVKSPGGDDEDSAARKSQVELRFEWRKSLKGKKKKTKSEQGRPDTAGSSTQKVDEAIDEGDESDPEDSETPWVCTLKIKRAMGASGNGLSPTSSRLSGNPPHSPRRVSTMSEGGGVDDEHKDKESRTIRLKVATMSPTPHHPKVVGMLKIPFPLADFDFSPSLPGGVVMRKRVPGRSPEPLVGADQGLPKGITLTAEEIKDVVSVSSLWLVVREGFGGVGKEKRKGDGWKLRG